MVTIKELATELQGLLNGTSANVRSGISRPFDGVFLVQLEGFHLDNVYDKESSSNFFPVFVGSGEGEFEALSDIGITDMNCPVSIYFPVRFKDQMLAMQNYIQQNLVGRNLLIENQRVITNISLCTLGEITQMDVDQYGNSILKGINDFIAEQYRMPVTSMEPWISLNFTLYASTMNAYSDERGLYGNDVTTTLAMFKKEDDTQVGLPFDVKADGFTYTYTAQTSSEQGFSTEDGTADDESSSMTLTSANGLSFTAYVRTGVLDYGEDAMYAIVHSILDGTLSKYYFKVTTKVSGLVDEKNVLEITRKLILTNAVLHADKGVPMSIDFTFVKSR